MERCYKPNVRSYKDYGGRGITVCDRWHDVVNFVADLESLHRPNLEIDRIDVNGNYEPSNVRFVTTQQNCDNRRSAINITYQGKTQSLKAWSRELGLNYGTLWERVTIWKWSAEKALSTPPLTVKERMAIARAVKYGKEIPCLS